MNGEIESCCIPVEYPFAHNVFRDEAKRIQGERFLLDNIRPYIPEHQYFDSEVMSLSGMFAAAAEIALQHEKTPLLTFLGLPESGKTAIALQGRSYIVGRHNDDAIAPSLAELARDSNSKVVFWELEWGGGYAKIPRSKIVQGDYHQSEMVYKREAKQQELEKVEKSVFGDVRKTIQKAEKRRRLGDYNVITLDLPLFTGYTKDDGSTVGMIRGEDKFKSLVDHMGEFAGLNYELFCIGVQPSSVVRYHNHQIRQELESTSDIEQIKEVFHQHNIFLDLPDEHILAYVRNMARVMQVEPIYKDMSDVIASIVGEEKLDLNGLVGDVSNSTVESIRMNEPVLYDKILAEAIYYLMSSHYSIPKNRGTLVVNNDISPITFSAPPENIIINKPQSEGFTL